MRVPVQVIVARRCRSALWWSLPFAKAQRCPMMPNDAQRCPAMPQTHLLVVAVCIPLAGSAEGVPVQFIV